MIFSGQCLVLENFVFLSCLCVVYAVSFVCDGKDFFYCTVMRCCIV